jgi:hypothetical protein
LTSDALGKWILQEVERGRDPFGALRAIQTRAQMDAFVATARAGGGRAARAPLGVDDTTMVRFVVPGAGSGR